ncbi:MAG TPA: hypothetical protein VM597_02315 [Gemmataceae bacterium]|nr:hypothetical protein [Gemmataceae bacterium]
MLLFVHPYLRGFLSVAHRLLSLFCVAFFLAIVWCDLGAELNIPALVWNANPLLQMAAGISITALFAHVWLVTYILDTRFHPEFIRTALESESRSIPFRVVRWLLPSPPGADADPDDLREGGDGLRWYLGVTFVPCTFLLLLPTFFAIHTDPWAVRITDPDTERVYLPDRWPFAVGIAVAVLGIRAIAWVGGRVIRWWWTTDRRKRVVREWWMQTVAGALFVALFTLYTVTALLVGRGLWQPPPVTAVCMLIGLLVGIGGALWFHMRYWAVPVFAIGLGWLVYCNSPDHKTRFPYLTAEYAYLTDEAQQYRTDLRTFEEPAARLADVVSGPETADREKDAEITRVARLVAARRAQAHDSVARESTIARLKNDGLMSRDRYDDLRAEYRAAFEKLTNEEDDALRVWRAQFPKNRDPVLVVVTATGGANRSALWTAEVLHQLHSTPEFKDFPKHVRVIAGASGGMVGAAYYVGSLQPPGVLPDEFRPKDVAQDFLTPIINGLVFRDVPFLGLPTDYYPRDRGEMLDLAMEGEALRVPDEIDEKVDADGQVKRKVITGGDVRARLSKVFRQSFDELKAGEQEGWRPSLIFSPMMVEDGRRLFISNRHLPFLTVNRGEFLLPNGPAPTDAAPATVASPRVKAAQNQPGRRPQPRRDDRNDENDKRDVYSRPGVEFFALYPEARGRFRLSTAARMNATFPFLSPAVSLPTRPVRRVVDAGYYDNTGVSVAAAWLYRHADTLIEMCSGVVVIQIRDSVSHRENRALSQPPDGDRSIAPGLTDVLAAVAHARTATATYRNDEDLQTLADYFREHGRGAQFFTTVVFERYSDVGMNWYLSPADKKDILDSWTAGDGNMNPATLEDLKTWWKIHSR